MSLRLLMLLVFLYSSDLHIGKYPVIQEIKDLMEAHGALRAMMSGSGPTVFGIFDDKNKMKAAARILRSSHLAKTVFATEVFNRKD